MLKTIAMVCVVLEVRKISSCKVLKGCRYDTWLKDLKNGRDKGASSYVKKRSIIQK